MSELTVVERRVLADLGATTLSLMGAWRIRAGEQLVEKGLAYSDGDTFGITDRGREALREAEHRPETADGLGEHHEVENA